MSNSIILKITDFTLSYEPKYFRARTVRDLFVAVVTSPLRFFKSPERQIVLQDVNLTIHKGQVVGVLGANGVGKTSLCRYLSGIIKNNQVQINGEARAIFEHSLSIYPDLTGRENAIVLIELLYSGLSKEEKNSILEEAVIFSELTESIDLPFKNYSRGMKARLCSSLLTAKPVDLLIIDEAFDGMDQFYLEKMKPRLKSLIHSCGATIMVSHKLEEIKNYCDQAIVLHDKKIAFHGPVNDAISFYNSLGEM